MEDKISSNNSSMVSDILKMSHSVEQLTTDLLIIIVELLKFIGSIFYTAYRSVSKVILKKKKKLNWTQVTS